MSDELAVREAEEMEQMDLALQGEKLYIDYSERLFQYTGERFIRDHPDRAKIAIKLIALGFKNEPIAKRVHSDHRTIRELRYRCINEVEKQKEELRAVVFPGVMMSADRTLELIPNIQNAKDAAITHGILRDTFVQLSGVPAAHIKLEASISIPEQIANLLAEATEKMKQAKARVIDPMELEEAT